MKMPENNAVIDTAIFMTFVATPEVGRHRGRDVEGGLGKQPEGQHAENDAEKESVVAAIRARLSGHRCSPLAASLRSLFHRSVVATKLRHGDGHQTGGDDHLQDPSHEATRASDTRRSNWAVRISKN